MSSNPRPQTPSARRRQETCKDIVIKPGRRTKEDYKGPSPTEHEAIKATTAPGLFALSKLEPRQKPSCTCKRLVCSRLAIKNVQWEAKSTGLMDDKEQGGGAIRRPRRPQLRSWDCSFRSVVVFDAPPRRWLTRAAQILRGRAPKTGWWVSVRPRGPWRYCQMFFSRCNSWVGFSWNKTFPTEAGNSLTKLDTVTAPELISVYIHALHPSQDTRWEKEN